MSSRPSVRLIKLKLLHEGKAKAIINMNIHVDVKFP